MVKPLPQSTQQNLTSDGFSSGSCGEGEAETSWEVATHSNRVLRAGEQDPSVSFSIRVEELLGDTDISARGVDRTYSAENDALPGAIAVSLLGGDKAAKWVETEDIARFLATCK